MDNLATPDHRFLTWCRDKEQNNVNNDNIAVILASLWKNQQGDCLMLHNFIFNNEKYPALGQCFMKHFLNLIVTDSLKMRDFLNYFISEVGFESADEYFDKQRKNLEDYGVTRATKPFMLGLGNSEHHVHPDHGNVDLAKRIDNGRRHCKPSSYNATATSKCTSVKNIPLFGHQLTLIS